MKRIIFSIVSILCTLSAFGQDDCLSVNSSALFDLNQCHASMGYEEFTALIDSNDVCNPIEIVGGHLYRLDPISFGHSCTPGPSFLGMCVSSDERCTYEDNSPYAIKIDVLIKPDGGTAGLTELSFYEKSNPVFIWASGQTGPNDYPTRYGVVVKVDGTTIYENVNIPTNIDWTMQTFDFTGLADFTVSEPTEFNIELMGYCPVGNGAPIKAWDVDEISISAGCSTDVVGGILEGGPFEFCVGDGMPDRIDESEITLSDNIGANSQWVITDDAGNILGLPNSFADVDFDDAGVGTCLIWHLSHSNNLEGAVVGNNASDLEGCFELSNPIEVNRINLEGGVITGGPFSFCNGDGNPDVLGSADIMLFGGNGSNNQWVITDGFGIILGLPDSFTDVDFDVVQPGTCLIWHVTYEDGIEGLEEGLFIEDLSGCFGITNSVIVNRTNPFGGDLEGGPFQFCVGDGNPDFITSADYNLTNHTGPSNLWLVTDEQGNILGAPTSLLSVNFDVAEEGTCLVWHMSYVGNLEGAVVGNNVSEIIGCFSLSNSMEVIRSEVNGGQIESNIFQFCVGDGVPDIIDDAELILTGNFGPNFLYVITDNNDVILGSAVMISEVDFDLAPEGICLIRHMSYVNGLLGLEVGNTLNDLVGCHSLSNSIPVIRSSVEGGQLEGGPFSFCVGDGIADFIDSGEIVLTGNSGTTSQWVITNDQGMILGLPSSFADVDFDEAGGGNCLIWHVTFESGLTGLGVGSNVEDLVGCYAFTNSVSVERNAPMGGIIEGGPFTFCVGDDEADFIGMNEITLTGNAGTNSQWVVTNDQGVILGLPGTFADVDFDDAPIGTCLVWHLSYEDGLQGAEIGNNASDLEGCFSLSNAIQVIRTDDPTICGMLTCPEMDEMMMYGIVDNNLIMMDAASGQLLKIIPLITDFEGTFGAFTWNEMDDIFYVVADRNTNPTLATIDRYTGIVSSISEIREVMPNAIDLTLVEGLEYNPDDQMLYGSGGVNPSNDNFNSPNYYRINKFNGDASGLSTFTGSCQNEVDFLATSNGVWYYLDGCPNPNEFGSFDTTTGIQTNIATLSSLSSGRLDVNPANDQIWILDALERNAYQIDDSGTLSFVGSIYPDGYFEEFVRDIDFAPFSYNGILGGLIIADSLFFCVDDGEEDLISESEIIIELGTGGFNGWVITDEMGTIIGLPDTIFDIDFEGAESGTCYIQNISFDGIVEGLEMGSSIDDLIGCFDFSNPIVLVRQTGADCGNVIIEEEEKPVDVAGQNNKFSIYPNPASQSITIKNEGHIGTDLVVNVYTIDGQMVFKTSGQLIDGENTVDISLLSDGIYLVKIFDGVKMETQRLIITD